ncbi:MAG: U32 family peptidase [Lachnospiraceae bacterium]|nr:U32 family peptidase [Lachnospiraceae bacterium]
MSVELLAPCGSYESFLAAVNAGADAVYLAGNKYGARAYAENFDQEKLCYVIMQAHARKVKVYLTVNTLVKDAEFEDLYDYLFPIVNAGLDGIIIQDLGVFEYLKREFVDKDFPELELHASTQMTITSKYGAAFMKAQGCKRIVPARELSLQEIQDIKESVDIEIETFIHGAMCYCYSGQCLMSSFIGGRSGNRGRCAQPCRLIYTTENEEGYYLSLKDMNTLQFLPQLMEVGINSFKIEGRMKKPEYVAGVVSIYRKYIDAYLRDAENFRIDKKDLELLHNLYIRSETSEGYYKKHNGRDMITLSKPGYNGTDDKITESLRQTYVKELEPISVKMSITCHVGQPLSGSILTQNGAFAYAENIVIEASQKRAATKDDIEKQMKKLGNTPFVLEYIETDLGENCFLPVKALNDLRRELVHKLVKAIYGKEHAICNTEENGSEIEENSFVPADRKDFVCEKQTLFQEILSVSVSTMEQLNAVIGLKETVTGCILVDSDLLVDEYKAVCKKIEDAEWGWGIKLPNVLRLRDADFLDKLQKMIAQLKPQVIYVSTLDGLGYLKQIGYSGQTAGEASLYTWNRYAYDLYTRDVQILTIPTELNSNEIRSLCEKVTCVEQLEMSVYERVTLMTTANCIKCTKDKCDHNRLNRTTLKDRMGNVFPVYTNCNHCYNKIYNYLPTSLYDSMWMLREDGIKRYRVDFTIEDEEETVNVLKTYAGLLSSENWKQKSPKQGNFTRGHIKRGVE